MNTSSPTNYATYATPTTPATFGGFLKRSCQTTNAAALNWQGLERFTHWTSGLLVATQDTEGIALFGFRRRTEKRNQSQILGPKLSKILIRAILL